MNYYRAPDTFDLPKEKGEQSIFLAGSISNAKNWQQTIAEISYEGLKLGDIFNIFNPRRENYNVFDPKLELEQIEWEYRAIHFCGQILFWFSNETLAPITLFELGSALHTHIPDNIFIGIDPEYQRKNDVIIQTSLRDKDLAERIVFSQEELVEQIVKKTVDNSPIQSKIITSHKTTHDKKPTSIHRFI